MFRTSSVCALVALSACAPKRWVNPAVTDPQQVDIDQYECAKENSVVGEQVVASRAGVRSGVQVHVDPQLFEACMRARGYTEAPRKVRDEGDPGWLRRPATSQGPVVELEVGAGTGAGLRSAPELDLSPLVADPSTPLVVAAEPGLDTVPAITGRVGLVWRPATFLDLGLWAGVRSSGSTVYVDCDSLPEGYDAYNSDLCSGTYDSGLAPALSAGVRLRPPSAPRLWVGAELGAQTVGPVPATSDRFTLYGPGEEDGVEVEVQLTESERTVLPLLRGGLGLDLFHPDPLGLALSCGAELALGDPSGAGPATTATCAATLRLSPRAQ